MQSESVGEIAKALSQAQGEFPAIPKSQKANLGTDSYEYADLAEVLKAVRPALAKHGVAVSQPLQSGAGHLILETLILHSSGEWTSSSYEVAAHDKPQEQGSAITYGRRYALAAILGIAAVEEDDDGAAATKAPEKPKPVYFPPPSAQSHKLPPREPGEDDGPPAPASNREVCPKCGPAEGKVIKSKYHGPTFACLKCKSRFGPLNDIPKD